MPAADVENTVAALQAKVRNHVLRDRHPASVVAVAAVAVFARAIEILLAIFARDTHVLVGFGVRARSDVALAARQLRKKIYFRSFIFSALGLTEYLVHAAQAIG